MSAASRRKGAAAEQAVVRWLRDHGWPRARRFFSGDGHQPGDIDGVPGVTLEVKDHKTHRIAEWLRQVEAEAAPATAPVVVVHPPGVADPGRWWAVMRLEELAVLLRDREDLDDALAHETTKEDEQ